MNLFYIRYLTTIIPPHIGVGKAYNLPRAQVIIGNNFSIEFSSVRIESEKLINISKGYAAKTLIGPNSIPVSP